MTIPREAVQAASKRIDDYYDTPNCVGETAVRAALTAAAPFLQGVKVDARQALDRFAEAAKNWGWQEDQGYNEGVIQEAKTEFDASYSALENLLSTLDPSHRAQALEEAAQVADKGNAGWLKKRDVTANKKEARDYETMAIACSHVAAAIRALSSQPVADHIADAGKVEGDGSVSAKSHHVNGGAFRRLTQGEWRELGGDDNPECDWHEGIGYVIYDDQAHQEYLKKTNALPASPEVSG